MAKKKLNISHNMHSFFKNAFANFYVKEDANTLDAANSDKVIPHRLTKKNLAKHWYTEAIQVPSPFNGEYRPSWGTFYPFAPIVGCNLGLGTAAAGKYHNSWVKKALDSNEITKQTVDALLAKAGDSVINTDCVIYMPLYPITGEVKYSSKSSSQISNTYGWCKTRKYKLIQQFCDLDDDGNVYLSDNVVSNVVLDKINGTLCQLVKILDIDKNLIKRRFNISDAASCMKYYDEIIVKQMKNQVNDPSRSPSEFGNKNYCRYLDYFAAQPGCRTSDNRMTIESCRSFCEKMVNGANGVDKFFDEIVLKYGLESIPEKTYVWMPLRLGPTTATEKNVKIFEQLKTSAIFDIGKKKSNKAEGINESAPISTNEIGDIQTSYNNFQEAFFGSMVYMMQNTNIKKELITFPTDNHNNLMMLNGDVLNQMRTKNANGDGSAKGMRVFIKIDDISDDHIMNFSPFFADERFKGSLDKTAPKKFYYRVISGNVFGFNLDVNIEAARADMTSDARTQHKKGNGAVNVLFDAYMKQYGDKLPKDQSFSIVIMRPEGDDSDINKYFFYTGFGEPTAAVDDDIAAMTTDEHDAIKDIMSAKRLGEGAYIWYNGATEIDDNRRIIASHGKTAERDRAGKIIN